MDFPYETFLNDYNIPYITHGAHVATGNIAVNCFYCQKHGKGDHKYHMGVSLSGKGYGCWRSSDHRGKSAVTFVAGILDIPPQEAKGIVADYTHTTLDKFSEIASVWDPLEAESRSSSSSIEWPDTFVKPCYDVEFTHRHINYLISRGIPPREVEELCAYYDLRAADDRWFFNRIIFPVHSNQSLIGWSGRSIEECPELRWKMLSCSENKSPYRAIESNKYHIGNENNLYKGGKVLVLVEGQFDFLKIDWWGKKYGVRSGCMFTKALTEDQIALIHELTPLYDRTIFMLDAETGLEAQALALKFPSVSVEKVPYGRGDAGEMTKFESIKFARKLIQLGV